MDTSKSAGYQHLAEIKSTVSRYRDYGWEWGIITKVINRYYATRYTVAEIVEIMGNKKERK